MIWRHVVLALPLVESVPEHVLDRAGRIVRGLGAELDLFHSDHDARIAEHVRPGRSLAALIRERVEAKQRRLEHVADTLRDQGLTVRTSVRWDYPIYEAIVRHVLHHGADLVIVPAARLGHGSAITLAYTDARLVEACPCPLLLLKTEQVYSRGPVVAAVDPMHARGKPAELDERIVAGAKTLARALAGAPVYVYHACAWRTEPEPAAPSVAVRAEPISPERQKAYQSECELEVRNLAAEHELPSDFVHVESGAVASVLPSYVRAARADAVVMGAVSRSYPERALFGGTAEKVLDALECDVLIMKPSGFRSPVGSRVPRAAARRTGAARARAAAPG